MKEVLRDLSSEIAGALAQVRSEPGEIDYWAEARYPQQTWEVEVPLPKDSTSDASFVEAIVSKFHETHERLYAVCDRGSPIEIIGWRAQANCRVTGVTRDRLKLDKLPFRPKKRAIYFDQDGWVAAPVWPSHELVEIQEIPGPAIVESSYTTLVVPPRSKVIRCGAVLKSAKEPPQ
jgi:N-methylhydantoinase A